MITWRVAILQTLDDDDRCTPESRKAHDLFVKEQTRGDHHRLNEWIKSRYGQRTTRTATGNSMMMRNR
jgi:hypothetical protein